MGFWYVYWKSLLFFFCFGVLPAWLGFALIAFHSYGYPIPEWLLFRFGRIGIFFSGHNISWMATIYFLYFLCGCIVGKLILESSKYFIFRKKSVPNPVNE